MNMNKLNPSFYVLNNKDNLKENSSILPAAALMCALSLSACGGSGNSKPSVFPEPPVITTMAAEESSFYLEMRDGVKIAVDLYLPSREQGDKLPVVMMGTRYWRDDHQYQETGYFSGDEEIFNERGYAYAVVDARGTGASFGTRDGPFTAEEAKDYDEVITWLADQDWSNGNVATIGHSYEGTTALNALENGNTALKAVFPYFADESLYRAVVFPGGVYQTRFVNDWISANKLADSNDACKYRGIDEEDCADYLENISKGVKSVDDDADRVELEKAVKEHEGNADIAKYLQASDFIDDKLAGGNTFRDISPIKAKDNIIASNVPIISALGWFDAGTILGGIDRFNTYDNPQIMYIGPWGHGMEMSADPYDSEQAAIFEDGSNWDSIFDILDKTLVKNETITLREIRYLTINDVLTDDGDLNWKITEQWPPNNVVDKTWYLNSDNSFAPTIVSDDQAFDSYTVDYTTNTGENNRWQAQQPGDLVNVIYGDRAEQDKKLLTYTSEPLTSDIELTGDVIVDLFMTSTHEDGAIFAYLESEAPDGSVTYITEGMLRLIHRKISDANQDDYVIRRPYHSFKEEDAQWMIPGEPTQVTFAMFSTSVLIKEGHKLRIAIAGHDATSFERIPEVGDPTITILRSEEYRSSITLPIAF